MYWRDSLPLPDFFFIFYKAYDHYLLAVCAQILQKLTVSDPFETHFELTLHGSFVISV